MRRAKFKFNLKNNMFLSFSLVMLCVIIVFDVVLYFVLSNNHQQSSLDNQAELTGKILDQTDSFLSEMDTIAMQAMSHPQLLAYFIELDNGDMDNYFMDNIIEHIDASTVLTSINGPSKTVDRISVFNPYGDYVSTGKLYETKSVIAGALQDTRRINDWMQSLRQSENKRVILDIHTDFWSNNEQLQLISLIRPVSSAYSNDVYGVVEVQQDSQRLMEKLNFETLQNIEIWIYDANGVEITQRAAKVDIPDAYSNDDWPDNRIVSDTIDGEKYYITRSVSDFSGWTVALAQTQRDMFAPMSMTYLALSIGSVLLLVVMCALIYYVANRVSKPLIMLCDSISRVSWDNMTINMSEAEQTGEVAMLDSAFKALFSRLSESMVLEMKAHMVALQTKMKPHFLFNTLAVVSAAGQEAGNGKVVTMCAKLSDMLRYIVTYEDAAATMADEIRHTQNYLDLMKQRYEELFQYSISTHGGVEEMLIPKLVLQPLTENCFQHGFAHKTPPWRITIDIGQSERRFWIHVSDNGGGMEQNVIDEIMANIKKYQQSTDVSELSIGGLGLVSIVIRLSMVFPDLTFDIASGERGTTVKLGGWLP